MWDIDGPMLSDEQGMIVFCLLVVLGITWYFYERSKHR